MVNIHDPLMTKRTLDAEVAACFDAAGCVEDMTLSNVRIAFGLLACVAALGGQFWPTKLPQYSREVAVCVVAYFVLSSLMTVTTYLVDGECILLTKANTRLAHPRGLIVLSKMPRGTGDYTVSVAHRDVRRSRFPAAETRVSTSASVAEFFDSNGVFLQLKFREKVRALYAEFTAQHGGGGKKKTL